MKFPSNNYYYLSNNVVRYFMLWKSLADCIAFFKQRAQFACMTACNFALIKLRNRECPQAFSIICFKIIIRNFGITRKCQHFVNNT